MKNEFVFEGAVKWPPTLKTTANNNPLLPLTLEQDKASISMVLFQEVASSLAAEIQQGSIVMVKGYQNQRQDQKSNWWHNAAVANEYSLDSGKTWVSEQSLKQQYQTQQGQNPQVAHLQQCQQQFQQQPTQQHQTQQGQQAAQAQTQTQTREQFLNTNQYQNQPPSPAATAAQRDLYSPPTGQQSGQQTPAHTADGQQQTASASVQAQPQKKLTSTDPWDDEIKF